MIVRIRSSAFCLLISRLETSARAVEAHVEPVERVDIVQSERPAAMEPELNPPRDVRVATQGDRFYVEMNRGERRWYRGLAADGAIWLTLGPRRAIVVDPDECGPPLQYFSHLYTLNPDTPLCSLILAASASAAETTNGACRRIAKSR